MLLMISKYFFQTLHMINIYSRWLICFARMDFPEQSPIKDQVWDVRCDEKFIQGQTYQW